MRSPVLMLLAITSIFAVPVYHLPETLAQPVDLQVPTKPDPLPASARPAVERCEKAMTDAKKIYETACTKARAQAVKELEPAIKTETQKGNLDGALVIKAKIEEYKQDQPKLEIEKPKILGRWTWHHGKTVVFKPDGTAIKFLGSTKVSDGKWKEINGTIKVDWRDNFHDTVVPEEDTAKVTNEDSGDQYDIKRFPDKE